MNLSNILTRQITFLITAMLLMVGAVSVSAQEKSMDDKELQKMQTTNESYMVDIYEIVDGYPKFNYEYVYDNGKLKEVTVTGIDDPARRDQVATLIYSMRSNKDRMKNYCNTHGIYYAPEKEAEPKVGFNEFREEIQENLEYPDRAENLGVEGTVYVKFVVDENGDITNMVADHDIDSPYGQQVENLEEEALAAVEEVDTEWEPALVDGDHVDSWVVVPVTFDFQKHPALPALVR